MSEEPMRRMAALYHLPSYFFLFYLFFSPPSLWRRGGGSSIIVNFGGGTVKETAKVVLVAPPLPLWWWRGLPSVSAATTPTPTVRTVINDELVPTFRHRYGRGCRRRFCDAPQRRREHVLVLGGTNTPPPPQESTNTVGRRHHSVRVVPAAHPLAFVGIPPPPREGTKAARTRTLWWATTTAGKTRTSSGHRHPINAIIRPVREPSSSIFTLNAMAVTIRIVGRSRGGGGGGGGGSASSSSSSSTSWIEDGCATYQKRLQGSSLQLATDWSKTDDDLVKAVQGDEKKGHYVVLLDPRGASLTSEQFAVQLYQWLERGGSRLTFVIGGAEGLPKELMGRGGGSTGKSGGAPPHAPTLISLSDLTFTHQMARLLLVEQIYRASEIRRGSGYHK